MDVKEILKHVDHTLLKQTATWEDIKQICDDGIKYGCASVCIPQTYVNHAAHYVAEQQHYGFGQLPICTVIGFPNGYTPSGIKCMEAESAVADGATEIDMVINLGWVKEGQYDKILQEINSVKISCHGNILKVIIETCLLTDEEKIKLCEVVSNSHADYIKTSTGFAGGGATREDVALMAAHMTNGKKIRPPAASRACRTPKISSSSAPTASARPASSRPSRSSRPRANFKKGEGSICRLRITARKRATSPRPF